MTTVVRRPLAPESAGRVVRGAAPGTARPQQATQWRANGSRQMGGVWNTNRYFVRRQFA